MSKPFQRIGWGAALVLGFIAAATSVAMKSFVFPVTAMQGLQMLHAIAIIGAFLLSMLLIATWVAAFFSGNARRDPSD